MSATVMYCRPNSTYTYSEFLLLYIHPSKKTDGKYKDVNNIPRLQEYEIHPTPVHQCKLEKIIRLLRQIMNKHPGRINKHMHKHYAIMHYKLLRIPNLTKFYTHTL